MRNDMETMLTRVQGFVFGFWVSAEWRNPQGNGNYVCRGLG